MQIGGVASEKHAEHAADDQRENEQGGGKVQYEPQRQAVFHGATSRA